MTTEVPLPEPLSRDDTEHGKDYYTEADLLAYGDERAKAAAEAERERIAQMVEKLDCAHRCCVGGEIAEVIRAGHEARRTAEHPAPAAVDIERCKCGFPAPCVRTVPVQFCKHRGDSNA